MIYKVRVEKILFPKNATITEANEFTIFTAKVIDIIEGEDPVKHPIFGTITIKGETFSIRQGKLLELNLEAETHEKYGVSYKINSTIYKLDRTDKRQVKDFLEVLVSPVIAQRLLEVDNVIDKIENEETEELLKVKGLGLKGIDRLYENYSVLQDNSYAYSKLSKVGISKKLISKMCKQLRNPKLVVDMCYNNPFELIDKIPNLGFLKADEIATKCGYLNSELRNRYAVLYLLDTYGEQGQSIVLSNDIINDLKKLTNSDFYEIDKVVTNLCMERKILLLNKGEYIASTKYYELEKKIALLIKDIIEWNTNEFKREDILKDVEDLEKEQGWSYTSEQKEAIIGAILNNFTAICGKAGTGKTTIIKAILKILKYKSVALTSLSAKACQRMREATGYEAMTLHRLLGIKPNVKGENIELYHDVVIVDESTMINGTLFLKLFKSLKYGAKVILTGDIGQLTTIGNCSVFEDVLKNNKVAVYELNEIHRQAKKSAIITSSMLVRESKNFYKKGFIGTQTLGELQDLTINIKREGESVLEGISETFLEKLNKYNSILDVQLITPLKDRGEVCCKNLNLLIKSIYNKNSINNENFFLGKNEIPIHEGDKVICTKNNYKIIKIKKDYEQKIFKKEDLQDETFEYTHIFNGNIGIVVKILNGLILVDFQDAGLLVIENNMKEYIDLSYCISVHSAQGSQWKCVIVSFDISSYKLLNIEMLYTMLTRASKNCIIFSNNVSVEKALRTIEKNNKRTFLSQLI